MNTGVVIPSRCALTPIASNLREKRVERSVQVQPWSVLQMVPLQSSREAVLAPGSSCTAMPFTGSAGLACHGRQGAQEQPAALPLPLSASKLNAFLLFSPVPAGEKKGQTLPCPAARSSLFLSLQSLLLRFSRPFSNRVLCVCFSPPTPERPRFQTGIETQETATYLNCPPPAGTSVAFVSKAAMDVQG